ncbi:MAG: hypothetical protein C0418_02985 [Coriobacteriaceae bacterium]|nr:hypothetical protein [Coriobacteriaceae bacterium]
MAPMTSDKTAPAAATEPRLTADDLRHKALRVRDLAEAEVRRITEEDFARNVAIAAAVVALAVGLAFYLGTRRARPCPPYLPLPPM